MKELKEHEGNFGKDLDEDLSKLKDFISLQLDLFYKDNKTNFAGQVLVC